MINAVLNGLIAFSSYKARVDIPYAEAAIDILITVAIITFFTAWIGVGSTRSELIKGNLSGSSFRFPKLPQSSSLRAAILMLFLIIVFGGVILDGALFLFAPNGLSNWAYIIFKTIYTGLSGALAIGLAVISVIADRDGKKK